MRLRLFAALLCFACPAVAQQIEPPDPAPTTPVATVELAPFEPTREEAVLEAYVDGVVAAHQRAHDAPAIAVSVVKDGRILFAKAYGEADVETRALANGNDTLFRIGSVSKTFIWTSVMMLYERGLIDLDTDVNAYLKGVVIPGAFDAPVTMNDLMAHRAGFEDTLAVFTYPDGGETSLTDALNATMPKRVFPPGARTSYSNWGSALAAKIVEDISGVPFEQFLQDEILKPLAMTHTTFKAPKLMTDDQRAMMAKGYVVKAGAYEPGDYMEIGPFGAAGAVASTANDMAQWMLVHLGGGEHDGVRLMRPETHELMWARKFDDRPAGADLAHGFMTRIYRGVETFGHGGATSLYYTDMTMVPELGAGVFVSQSATADRKLVGDLPWLVIDHLLDRPAEPARNDPAFETEASSFAGTYLTNRRSFSQFEKLFAISGAVAVTPAAGGGLAIAEAGESEHFAPLPGAADTFESRDGARIVFGRGGDGKITHYTDDWGVRSLERAGFATDPALFNLAFGLAGLFGATMLIGVWRRQGRGAAQTAMGAALGLGDMIAAALVFALAGMFGWVTVQLASGGAAAMLSYPPASVTALRLAGLGIFIAALGGAVSLWPAWRMSGWSLWRRLHHTVFVASLAFLAAMLVVWKVVFSATA
jgi:CubicO group peptidase (beta-lactamase class C family)